jgi:hypothetical protein
MGHFTVAFAFRYRYPNLVSVPSQRPAGLRPANVLPVETSPLHHRVFVLSASGSKADGTPFLHPGLLEGWSPCIEVGRAVATTFRINAEHKTSPAPEVPIAPRRSDEALVPH